MTSRMENGMMDEHQFLIGESVLVWQGGNQVPGVVTEIEGERALVTLAEPYVDETGQSQDQVWYNISELEPLLDETAPLELEEEEE
jgi:hypothetical protein